MEQWTLNLGRNRGGWGVLGGGGSITFSCFFCYSFSEKSAMGFFMVNHNKPRCSLSSSTCSTHTHTTTTTPPTTTKKKRKKEKEKGLTRHSKILLLYPIPLVFHTKRESFDLHMTSKSILIANISTV